LENLTMMIKDLEMSEDLTSAELSAMRGGSGFMALVGAQQGKSIAADDDAVNKSADEASATTVAVLRFFFW
jgi:hypothetical protein